MDKLEQAKQIVDGLKIVAPLLEASQKEADKILQETRIHERKNSFIDGYYAGIGEGRRRQTHDLKEVLGLDDPEEDRRSGEEAWEIYKNFKGIK